MKKCFFFKKNYWLNLFSQLENLFHIFISEWLKNIVFFGFYLVAKFHFYFYFNFLEGGGETTARFLY
jgi:hypothetical protein